MMHTGTVKDHKMSGIVAALCERGPCLAERGQGAYAFNTRLGCGSGRMKILTGRKLDSSGRDDLRLSTFNSEVMRAFEYAELWEGKRAAARVCRHLEGL